MVTFTTLHYLSQKLISDFTSKYNLTPPPVLNRRRTLHTKRGRQSMRKRKTSQIFGSIRYLTRARQGHLRLVKIQEKTVVQAYVLVGSCY